MGTFEGYTAALDRNQADFRRDHPAVFASFEVSLKAFDKLGRQLVTGRDRDGHSHVSLVPLFQIFQRQSTIAFHSVASYQAFLGWSMIRTGLEAVLIMGKWVDDPANADTWSNRDRNRRAYAKLFQGKALKSGALRGSPRIQSALSRVNDLLLHPNPSYYFRHLELNDLEEGATEMRLKYFDEPVDAAVGILGMLHLVAFVQDGLAHMFGTLFNMAPVDVGLASLEAGARSWARDTMQEGPGPKDGLIELGLWTDLTIAPPDLVGRAMRHCDEEE